MRSVGIWLSILFALLGLASLSVHADAVVAEELPPGFQPSTTNVNGDKFEFQSDNKRVLNIVINSLYKSKEIFLREIVSNAADAIDKIRFQSLTQPDILGETTDLAIRIVADKERKLLIISDTGIGMNAEELKKNLGTIARSGTSEFISLLEDKNADLNMIGQFGVGFYSVFLVCDRVTVASKSNDSPKQYVWESTSENDFTIGEDARGNTLGRGTEITLHLKDDALEFLEDARLGELITKYSEFITFPIYLWKQKTETMEVEPDEESNEDGVEEVAEAKTKTESRTYHAWERMNQNKPIWARKPAELDGEDYKDFYKAFTKDHDEPMAWTHFQAEGDNEFKSILFVPKRAPSNFLQKLEESMKKVKLFVRRVFITDDTDLLPRWLSFITGLVDSDDLPLNVSRETLQKHALLKSIKKKMIAKAIEMIRNIANDESKYLEFFKQYGVALKLGVVEDTKNKDKLTKILRFHSSHSEDGMTTFGEYKKRMRSKQPQIYYVTGPNLETLKNSPVVEVPLARGYEVLYLVDPMDEYVVQAVTQFDGTPLQSLSKGGLLYGDEDADEEGKVKEEFSELSSWLQSTLTDYIEAVVVSTRLAKSPTAVIANKMGLSGNMEKIMNAQALQSGENYMLKYYQSLKKTLEINPFHPLIKALSEKVKQDEKSPELVQLAVVLYQTTLIRSGFELSDSHDFAGRVEQILRSNLGVSADAEAEFTVVPAKERTEDERDATAMPEEVEHDEL
ncbi:heat-shock protein 90 [Chytriomyces sp. MP71]|nr:heat-shock protein 90 [Chytriomyces sp. MP71]